jgi:Ca2+-binding RTX toxin-like protein
MFESLASDLETTLRQGKLAAELAQKYAVIFGELDKPLETGWTPELQAIKEEVESDWNEHLALRNKSYFANWSMEGVTLTTNLDEIETHNDLDESDLAPSDGSWTFDFRSLFNDGFTALSAGLGNPTLGLYATGWDVFYDFSQGKLTEGLQTVRDTGVVYVGGQLLRGGAQALGCSSNPAGWIYTGVMVSSAIAKTEYYSNTMAWMQYGVNYSANALLDAPNAIMSTDWVEWSSGIIVSIASYEDVYDWAYSEHGAYPKARARFFKAYGYVESYDPYDETFGRPIAIDLDGDGIELTSLAQSPTFKDLDDDGFLENTGWVAADDGLLVIDLGEDGIIDQTEEMVLTEWAEEAETDLEALQIAFDSNDDLVFDSLDERWSEFRVWQDLDQDGEVDEGELLSLEDAGIVSIDLDLTPIDDAELWTDLDGDGVIDDNELTGDLAFADAPVIENRDGNVIYREANIEWEDGSAGKAYDTAFAYNPNGIKRDEQDGQIEVEFEDGSKSIEYEGADDIVLDLGEAGYSTAFGADGNDQFFTTGEESVVIDAGAGDDSLIGGDGDDLLSGGEGSDVINGGAGHDVLIIDADDLPENIDGGEGFDVAYVSGEEGVSIDLDATNLETVYGNAGDDTLTTSGDGDVLINGGDGNDFIKGSVGSDMLAGGDGSDTIHGGAGDDTIFMDAEDDVANIDGGEGHDALYVSDTESVTIDLAARNFEEGHGGSGDDDISTSGEEAVLIEGGAGNDTLSGNAGGDTLSGGADNDLLEGNDGADYLYGEAGDDTLHGGAGGDILNGGAGNDILDGGAGEDLYVFGHGSGQDVVEDAGGDFVYLTEDVTREDLNFTKSGNDLVLKINGTEDSLTLTDWFSGKDHQANGFVLSGTDPVNPDYVYVMSEGEDRYRLDDSRNWNIVTMGGEDNISGTWNEYSWNWRSGWQATEEQMSKGAYMDLGGGNDSAVGGSGNDTFQGGAGADTLDGKGGSDTAVYSSSNEGVTVDLSAGTATGGHAEGDKLTNIENLVGSEHADELTGTGGANTISGRGGDDVIDGQGGNDELIGGAGADTLKGGDGTDTASYELSESGVEVNLADGTGVGGDAEGDVLEDIENLTGSKQHDKLTGDDNANTLKGDAGHDFLDGGAGDDKLYGGTGDDILDGGEGADELDGGAGVDLLIGGEGNDTMDGGSGHDILLGGTGDDSMLGGEGHDRMDGGEGADTLQGGVGDDTMLGGAGNDLVTGGIGNDKLDGGEGADTLDGGAGDDVLLGGEGDDLIDATVGNDTVDGGAGNDTILAADGNSVIDGGEGDDFIEGGRGGDHIIGGDGTDTATYETSQEGVRIDLGAGAADYGQAIGDTLEGVENLTGSDVAGDQLTGDDNANVLDGMGGDDLIQGGVGADTLIGGEGTDTVSYADSEAGVTLDLSTGTGSVGDAEGDEISGFEHVIGSEHADQIIGSAGGETIEAGAGDDTLIGGAGADVLDGGAGVDLVDYSDSAEGVTVNLADGTGAGGDAEGDTLIGIENLTGTDQDDILVGDSQDNVIDSGSGDDVVAGMAGDDDLIAGAGDDKLSGGYGADEITLGAGDDFAMAGDGDDLIQMGDGNEIVDGGAGTDTAIFDGPAGDYVVETINGTTFVRHVGGETDVLREVEILCFDDCEISVADTVVVQAPEAEKKKDNDTVLARPSMTAAEMIAMAAALGIAAVATTKESSAYELGLLPSGDGDGVQDVFGSDDNSGFDPALVLGASENNAGVLAAGSQGAQFGQPLQEEIVSVDDSDSGSELGTPSVAQAGSGEEYAPEPSGIVQAEGGETVVEESEFSTTVSLEFDEDEEIAERDEDEQSKADFSMTLNASDVSGGEDSGIKLDIGAIMKFDVFQQALDVTITGLPVGAMLSHGMETKPGIWEIDSSELGALTITPPSDSASDFSLTVTSSGIGWGDYSRFSSTITRSFEVEVKAVADAPTMTVSEITTAASASSAAQNLFGTVGDDIINAGGGDDTIDGGAGADVIHGDTTAEATATASLDITAVLTDLDGSESLSLTVFGVSVGGSLSAGTEVEAGIWLLTPDQLAGLEITVPAGADDYAVDVVATSIDTDPDTGEQVTASTGPVAITVSASDAIGNDVIDGGAGNDVLYGEAGNDELIGSDGADTLYGGAGDDTLNIDGTDVVDGGDGVDSVVLTDTAGVDFDLGAANVEKALGNTGIDRFYTSGTGGIEVDGGAGDDVLLGGDGNDTLTGGAGSDAISAGAGDDFIVVDSSDDMAFIDGGAGNDSLTVEGPGGVTMDMGTAHIETAIGGVGNDEFQNTGSTATDVDGGAGNDLIQSGEGADTLKGGSGSDTVSYQASSSGVTVNLATGVVFGGYAAGDVISGFENVTGSASADVITGGDEINVLDGGAGNDVLTGGAGNDVITGGDGIDTAIYTGNTADFTITRRSSGVTVQDGVGIEGTDALTSIETLQFGDTAFDLANFELDGNVAAISGIAIEGQFGGQGEGLTYEVEDGPEHGSLTVNTDGTYSYTSTNGYTGDDSFAYKAVDSNGIVNIGEMDVDVNPSNKPRVHGEGQNPLQPVVGLGDGGYIVSSNANDMGVYPARVYNADGDLTAIHYTSRVTFGTQPPAIVTGLSDGRAVISKTWSQRNNCTVHFTVINSDGSVENTNSFNFHVGIYGGGGGRAYAFADGRFAFLTTNNVPLSDHSGCSRPCYSVHFFSASGETGGVAGNLHSSDAYLYTSRSYGTYPFSNGGFVRTEEVFDAEANSYSYVLTKHAAGSQAVETSMTVRTSVGTPLVDFSARVMANDKVVCTWREGNRSYSSFVALSENDISSTSGNDALAGGYGTDVITGSDGDDALYGNDGNDTLRGEAGNDSLTGGKGNDYIDGGEGTDTAIFDGDYADFTVTVDGDGNAIVEHSGNLGIDTLIGIEFIKFNDQTIVLADLAPPIALDMDGDGLEFINMDKSNVVMDVDSDGIAERVAWIGADDGFLAFDRNGDGMVTDFSEISFTQDHPDAKTDMEGLALAFDTNEDGMFDASDAKWESFGVWQDLNSDGVSQVGEFTSLDDAGISSINLISDWQAERMGDVWLHGKSSFFFEDGTQAELGDVGLMYDDSDVGGNDMIVFGDEPTAEEAWLNDQMEPMVTDSPMDGEGFPDSFPADVADEFIPVEDLLNPDELVDAMAVFSADNANFDVNVGLEEIAMTDVYWDEVDVESMTVDR